MTLMTAYNNDNGNVYKSTMPCIAIDNNDNVTITEQNAANKK